MMDKLKYTSGEWAIKERGVCIATDREPICVLCYCEERTEGNAQLIRAAPEMYEAILEILVILGDKPYRLNERWLENKLQSIIDKIHEERILGS